MKPAKKPSRRAENGVSKVRSPWKRAATRCALVLLAAGLTVGGIIAVGNLSRGLLTNQDRYQFEFGSVECPVPSGKDRAQFLAEVQYLSGIPERLSILDPNLGDTLMLAFSRHPRVKSVGKVEVVSRAKVTIELTFGPAE